MLEKLKAAILAGKDTLNKEIGKFKNRTFMEATVAGCALVAAADGNVSGEEKQKMAAFIKNSEELKVFDMPDVIAFFNKTISSFEFDHSIGEAEALKTVGKLRSNVDAARLMIRVCIAIGASDGNFDESEQKVVRQMAKELNLDPSDFGL
ncbi:tellurite resistance TerB family protein [Budvicia diplopodorum]|uniref:tellurite resistance TerB family protein n=1 Tax=Budvicia diplopodorum TaxID=1119056 RepID=UPI00135CC6C6|nr:tellurite resistance TerB family protein [Budvicia diplopodorum]